MGRLFWKVFLGFWLTILAISAIAMLAVFAQQRAQEQASEFGQQAGDNQPRAASGRRAERLVFRQALLLRHGGEKAVQEMLDARRDRGWRRARRANRQSDSRSERRRGWTHAAVRIVDDNDKDVFDRSVAPGTLEAARNRHASEQPASGIEAVTTPQGRNLIVFIPQIGDQIPMLPPLPWYQRLSPQVIVIGGLLFSMLFSGLLAWYLARPIRAVREGFKQVDAGNLDARVSAQIGNRRDELADLGQHFDQTIEHLQQLIQSQRRLLHDVSHELRSPLARMQAAIGLMRQNPSRDPKMFERMEREAERLDELVGEILTLARLEEQKGHGEQSEVDLDDLIADIANDAQFEGASKDLQVLVDGAVDQPIIGYPILLQRAIENLVRNAVKYTKPASRIEIRVNRSDTHAQLEVLDQGPGIEPQEIARATDPFFRAGQVIDNQNPITGFGLGLAIAKRSALLHGGDLVLVNRRSGGLRASISFALGSIDAN